MRWRRHRVARRDLSAASPSFAEELARLKRRIERIAALRRGDATATVVSVAGGWVKRHERVAHERIVIRITSKR